MRNPTAEFEPVADPAGRVQVWNRPVRGREYVIGADFAYGLPGRDYDAAVVLDITDRPVVQVAEVHGHWGERFDEVLAQLGFWYNAAFIVGERQVGGPILTRMRRVFQYPNLYIERAEDQITKQVTMRFGWHRRYDDITLRNFRRAVMDQKVILRSAALVDQIAALQWYQTTESDAQAHDDDRLRLRLPMGEGGRRPSPDLVMAACYAWHAYGERPKFISPAEKLATGQRLTEAELLELDSR